MRVIAGKYRGRNLKSPPSLEVRPTSDRLRETLFNVLAPRLEGARFLDLCAGSGAVGIEALSRGASHVTFVDQSRKMCSLIKSNLDLCRIEQDQNVIVQSDAHEFLRRSVQQKPGSIDPPDLVFFDPPYADDYRTILETFGTSGFSLLSRSGLLIVEHYYKNQLIDAAGSIIRSRILRQGDSALSFYQLAE
jgi:16S rRNA (guanine966-N2)-methyltransferase